MAKVQQITALNNQCVAWLILRELAYFIRAVTLGELMIYQMYTHAM